MKRALKESFEAVWICAGSFGGEAIYYTEFALWNQFIWKVEFYDIHESSVYKIKLLYWLMDFVLLISWLITQ